jgi:hypothetical protein
MTQPLLWLRSDGLVYLRGSTLGTQEDRSQATSPPQLPRPEHPQPPLRVFENTSPLPCTPVTVEDYGMSTPARRRLIRDFKKLQGVFFVSRNFPLPIPVHDVACMSPA